MSSRASSMAMESMSRQYMAIQLVASDCSMKLPRPREEWNGRTRRCCRGREIRPEKRFSLQVLTIDPPGEIDQQLVKDTHQEFAVCLALDARGNFVDAPGSPGVHGRIHVGKIPLVGRQLAVRMHVPFAQKEHELILGVIGIDQGHGDAMESEIPGGVPGILPFVRHGDDVRVVKRAPVVISAIAARRVGRRLRGIAGEPALHIIVIALLAPDQPGEGLALNQARVLGETGAATLGVKIVGFFLAQTEDIVEAEAEESCARIWPARRLAPDFDQ